jgi:putative transposase
MKGKRFTDEQIAYALRQAEGGTPVADVCRQLGVSEASFYLWKKKYAKLGLTKIRELRQLRDENARLKRLMADLTLDNAPRRAITGKRTACCYPWVPERLGRIARSIGLAAVRPLSLRSRILHPGRSVGVWPAAQA